MSTKLTSTRVVILTLEEVEVLTTLLSNKIKVLASRAKSPSQYDDIEQLEAILKELLQH